MATTHSTPLPVRTLRSRLDVDERRFALIANIALAGLTLIVFTGAAVRLTDSGLGCPTWPRCAGQIYPPTAGLHPIIEFSNRVLSGFVGVSTLLVAVASLRRRPFRRDLVWLSWSLPLGVIAQAVLGGFTVKEKLAPGFVMSHFLLSMLILVAAFTLAWRATHEPRVGPPTGDRPVVWSVRGLLVLSTYVLFAGTAATAAGPHSGGHVGQVIKRLHFKGANTLEWVVNQHATAAAIFGVLVIAVWFLKRQRGHAFAPAEPLTILGVLLAGQGLVGAVQYELKLPGEMVWVHVAMATVSWLVCLWAVAVEGSPAPRGSAPARPVAPTPLAAAPR